MFSYFPKLRDEIDVRKIAFARPRPEIIAVLGEEGQGCPVLILADPAKAEKYGFAVKHINCKPCIDDHKAIIRYIGLAYGVSLPAHD